MDFELTSNAPDFPVKISSRGGLGSALFTTKKYNSDLHAMMFNLNDDDF